jgi:hypothetical protein
MLRAVVAALRSPLGRNVQDPMAFGQPHESTPGTTGSKICTTCSKDEDRSRKQTFGRTVPRCSTGRVTRWVLSLGVQGPSCFAQEGSLGTRKPGAS